MATATKRLFLTLLALASGSVFAEDASFIPPSGWIEAEKSALSPAIEIGYVANSSQNFAPSLNLAREKINVSCEEYLRAVKQIHESNRKNKWRRIGKIETLAGPAQLTELEMTTATGKIRMLQMIYVKDDLAYIVTATALKKDFPQYYAAFQKTFQSFKVTQ